MPSAVKSKRGPGQPPAWQRQEIHSQIAYYYGQGLNDCEIARQVGVCDKTVLRWRQRNDRPDNYGLHLQYPN